MYWLNKGLGLNFQAVRRGKFSCQTFTRLSFCQAKILAGAQSRNQILFVMRLRATPKFGRILA